nr:hypothetical protein Iba_chr05eCG10960 [Ipomoea batatas]
MPISRSVFASNAINDSLAGWSTLVSGSNSTPEASFHERCIVGGDWDGVGDGGGAGGARELETELLREVFPCLPVFLAYERLVPYDIEECRRRYIGKIRVFRPFNIAAQIQQTSRC